MLGAGEGAVVALFARTDDAGEDERCEAEMALMWPVLASDVCALWVDEGEGDDHSGNLSQGIDLKPEV